jgi:hypothetical protein
VVLLTFSGFLGKRKGELVWKNWTSQKAVLSDKLLGSCRYLIVIPGSPVNLIRRLIVKSLMRPSPIIELEINP